MPTILLIDDSRFLRIANEHILAKAGYQVVSAGDGEQALLIAADILPDAILLDMMLPRWAAPRCSNV
ncbi:MAG TPA: response regulator [Candidatus Angelobacter sp.]|nr:response regulator [Candidatus Angelobacter sp.]